MLTRRRFCRMAALGAAMALAPSLLPGCAGPSQTANLNEAWAVDFFDVVILGANVESQNGVVINQVFSDYGEYAASDAGVAFAGFDINGQKRTEKSPEALVFDEAYFADHDVLCVTQTFPAMQDLVPFECANVLTTGQDTVVCLQEYNMVQSTAYDISSYQVLVGVPKREEGYGRVSALSADWFVSAQAAEQGIPVSCTQTDEDAETGQETLRYANGSLSAVELIPAGAEPAHDGEEVPQQGLDAQAQGVITGLGAATSYTVSVTTAPAASSGEESGTGTRFSLSGLVYVMPPGVAAADSFDLWRPPLMEPDPYEEYFAQGGV